MKKGTTQLPTHLDGVHCVCIHTPGEPVDCRNHKDDESKQTTRHTYNEEHLRVPLVSEQAMSKQEMPELVTCRNIPNTRQLVCLGVES